MTRAALVSPRLSVDPSGEGTKRLSFASGVTRRPDPCRGQAAVGSLAGAVRPEKRGRVDHESVSVGTETSRSV